MTDSTLLNLPAVTQVRNADRVLFFLDGTLFTSYVFGDEAAARPYFYPLMGPDNQAMMRHFPVEPAAPGEPTDHPHHRSLWCGHGSVNGHDNWNEPKNHAWTRFRRLEPETAPDSLIAHSDWEDADGNLLCHERLQVTIIPLPHDERMMDWRVTITAPQTAPVTLGDTKECGMVAVRVAAPLQEPNGGVITNADGGKSEAACWGKPSRWCDYSGTLAPEAEPVGVAVLSHPQSYGHPTHWHVRGYGLFAANPFGLSSFTKGAEDGSVTLASGEALPFRYGVLLHRGHSAVAHLDDYWHAYTGEAG